MFLYKKIEVLCQLHPNLLIILEECLDSRIEDCHASLTTILIMRKGYQRRVNRA